MVALKKSFGLSTGNSKNLIIHSPPPPPQYNQIKLNCSLTVPKIKQLREIYTDFGGVISE